MEEKLLKLIKTAMECEKVSKKYYIEVLYTWENRLEVHIRDKETFEYIKSAEICLNEDIFTIDDITKKIEELIEEEQQCF